MNLSGHLPDLLDVVAERRFTAFTLAVVFIAVLGLLTQLNSVVLALFGG